jgi:hypothetical protein
MSGAGAFKSTAKARATRFWLRLYGHDAEIGHDGNAHEVE